VLRTVLGVRDAPDRTAAWRVRFALDADALFTERTELRGKTEFWVRMSSRMQAKC
jgi:hypothetical protein